MTFKGAGAYVDPAILPAGGGLGLSDPFVSDEDFLGFALMTTSTASEEGYVSISSGGWTAASSDEVIPAATPANGILVCTLADVAGGGIGGLVRQSLFGIPSTTSLQPGTEWAVRIRASPGLADEPILGGEIYEVWAGMGDGSTIAMADGIYFRFNSTVGFWVFVHERAGVQTTFTTAVTWSDAVFNTLGWKITPDGLSVEVYENGIRTATVTPATLTLLDDVASVPVGMFNIGAQANAQVYEVDRVRWEHPARV